MKRKYALQRLAKGDYLLLANDGITLWRLSTYEEDGAAINGATNKPVSGRFWGVWKYVGMLKYTYAGQRLRIDPGDWSEFEMFDCLLRTRGEAIDVAIGLSEEQAQPYR